MPKSDFWKVTEERGGICWINPATIVMIQTLYDGPEKTRPIGGFEIVTLLGPDHSVTVRTADDIRRIAKDLGVFDLPLPK